MAESIAKQWDEFAAAVVSSGATPGQRGNMRKAFYAGAWAVLMACCRIGDDDTPEGQGVAALVDMTDECEAFLRGEVARA